jgi:hypothetical protein
MYKLIAKENKWINLIAKENNKWDNWDKIDDKRE